MFFKIQILIGKLHICYLVYPQKSRNFEYFNTNFKQCFISKWNAFRFGKIGPPLCSLCKMITSLEPINRIYLQWNIIHSFRYATECHPRSYWLLRLLLINYLIVIYKFYIHNSRRRGYFFHFCTFFIVDLSSFIEFLVFFVFQMK